MPDPNEVRARFIEAARALCAEEEDAVPAVWCRGKVPSQPDMRPVVLGDPPEPHASQA